MSITFKHLSLQKQQILGLVRFHLHLRNFIYIFLVGNKHGFKKETVHIIPSTASKMNIFTQNLTQQLDIMLTKLIPCQYSITLLITSQLSALKQTTL